MGLCWPARIRKENKFQENSLKQNSRKRRITRIGMHVFSLGRTIFARREFCVRLFFFSRHMLKTQLLRDKYTPGDQKPFDIIDCDTLFGPRETWSLSCLCWPIVWLGLLCSNSDRWLTRLPMRDSVIKQGLFDNCLKQMRYRFIVN